MIRVTRKSQTDEELVESKIIKSGCWIDLVKPTKKEIDLIVKKTGVSRDFLVAALDEDERPRYDIENEILIIFRIPQEIKTNSDLKVKTIPLGVIITQDYLITVSLSKVKILEDFYEKLIKGFYTTKRTRFLIQILSRTNFYFIKYLDRIDNEISKMEPAMGRLLKNVEVIRLFKLQKILTYFQTAILANGNILEYILKGRVVRLYREDEDLVEDIITENKQAYSMTVTYNKILSNTFDAYASIVSNNLNVVMKLLTSLTIILSIPTIISSYYGMNVGLPFENNPMAFLYTLVISFFISAVIAFIFMKKDWL